MNTKSLLLALSIVLNIALVSVVAVLLNRKQAQADLIVPATNIASAAAPEPKPPRSANVPAVTNFMTQKFDWRNVESADYKSYIANLRGVGCPEETIRDIIVADVNKLFEARRKETAGVSTNKFQFWKPGNPFADAFAEDKIEQRQKLLAEKKALLKELLGVEITDKADMMAGMNPFESILDFLPADKQTSIMDLEQKYAGKLMKAMKDARGNPKLIKQIQDEKDVEMAQLLGPQKEEYDLRMSQTAMMMRMQMTDFEPTEQEFRDMFKLQKKFMDEFSPMQMTTGAAEVAKRTEAQKQLDNQMKAVLGEQRFKDYRYDQEWSSSSLKGVAQEFNVPKEQALKVFDLKAAAQEEAQKIRADQSLAPDRRQAALDGIRAETEKAVTDAIGEGAAKAYVDRGAWLKNLNRATVPKTAAGSKAE